MTRRYYPGTAVARCRFCHGPATKTVSDAATNVFLHYVCEKCVSIVERMVDGRVNYINDGGKIRT